MNYEQICRSAWNGTKKDTQPEYDTLVESYRGLLLARAEKAIREGVTSGDAFDSYERRAIQLSGKPAPEPAVAIEAGYIRVVDEEPEPKPKKTAKKLAAVKKAVKVVKKAAKKVAAKK